jgi:hypothetical protein
VGGRLGGVALGRPPAAVMVVLVRAAAAGWVAGGVAAGWVAGGVAAGWVAGGVAAGWVAGGVAAGA